MNPILIIATSEDPATSAMAEVVGLQWLIH
jgi:hypothetical protein